MIESVSQSNSSQVNTCASSLTIQRSSIQTKTTNHEAGACFLRVLSEISYRTSKVYSRGFIRISFPLFHIKLQFIEMKIKKMEASFASISGFLFLKWKMIIRKRSPMI